MNWEIFCSLLAGVGLGVTLTTGIWGIKEQEDNKEKREIRRKLKEKEIAKKLLTGDY